VREPIEIVLADNEQIVAEALQDFLENEEDLAVIGVSRNGQVGLHVLRGGQPQVVMLDLSSRVGLTDAIDEGRQGVLGKGIVALSTADHAETMRAASRLDGDQVQVVEATSSEQLVEALHQFVCGGGMLVSYTRRSNCSSAPSAVVSGTSSSSSPPAIATSGSPRRASCPCTRCGPTSRVSS
jgi:DNA-binding NarL/FixJ family response regulator